MRSLTYLALVVLVVVCMGDRARSCLSHSSQPQQQDCDCPDPALCMSLGAAASLYPQAQHVSLYKQKKDKPEVFAFVLQCEQSVWSKFDWTKLTTIALVGFNDTDLLCYAHQNGVKVVNLGNMAKSQLANATARAEFVEQQTNIIVEQSLDGINIDFEDPVDKDSPEETGLTQLVQELAQSVHEAVPAAEVSVDVAWSSAGIDGRYYDYTALGEYADLLFVMAYDEQSQIWDPPCSARANSGFEKAVSGVQSYLSLGIPSEKLVLGLPWYGYKYECLQFYENGTCILKEVPFRGCNCSDAAGREFAYSYMMDVKEQYNVTEVWEAKTETPYYSVQMDGSSNVTQMRYDNPRSLSYKINFALLENLRGVGMWTANFLDNSDTEEAQKQRDSMWGVMP